MPEIVNDDAWFTRWRCRELSRVEQSGITYLDYTGAALYPESLVRRDAKRLTASLLGNPHSQHRPSADATEAVESARRAILRFLHADASEYAVVLTANASASCRLVGESFPFEKTSRLVLTADNHNSVNGVREYARARGATIAHIGLDDELRLQNAESELSDSVAAPSLLAYPAQSNFSGVRHTLDLVGLAQSRGYRVLLDAAAFLPTCDLRLDTVKPDYVALSLYKITGYPTGIGALVVRHDALAELRRPAFAGGTVRWVSVRQARHRLLEGPESFEDGTLPFLAVGAVADALDAVQHAQRHRLGQHLQCLMQTMLSDIESIRHHNGSPVVRVHGPRSTSERGATIALSVLSADGTPLPYWQIEHDASEQRIAVRGGCFCNPGCGEHALSLPERADSCRDTLGDGYSAESFAECLHGSAVGAVRMSLGLGSVHADVQRAADFLERFAH